MAKVHFHYSTMNAGKSTSLLQSNHNYEVRDLKTYLFTPAVDAEVHDGKIHSRLGISKDAIVFDSAFNFIEYFSDKKDQKISCILVDEAQFLTKKQVEQLGKIVDKLEIPVLAFGIRTDFQGNLFEGSKFLLAWADNLKEIKTVCHCGRKATMVLRINDQGKVIEDGAQIEIGGEDKYVSVCRKHFFERNIG